LLDRFTALFLAPTLIQTPPPSTATAQAELVQQIGMRARPAIVRVVVGCSGTYSYKGFEYTLIAGEVGSGYFVDADGYIATSDHVLTTLGETGCRQALFRQLAERVTGEESFNNIPESARVAIRSGSQLKDVEYIGQVVLPTGDSFPFEIAASGTAIAGDADDIAIVKIETANAPTLRLATANAAAQTAAVTIGYFLEGDTQITSSPVILRSLSQGDGLGRADVVTGQVTDSAQLPEEKGFTLQLQTTLPMGISGSPVLNQEGEVVGMVTADGTNSRQTGNAAVAIATQTIRRMVEEAGANNQESQTDRLYQEGLTLFQQGKFEAATAKFQEVKALFPYQSEVNWLISQSNQSIAEGQKQAKLIVWTLGTGGVAITLLAAHLLLNSRSLRLNRLLRGKRKPSVPPAFRVQAEPKAEKPAQPPTYLNEVQPVVVPQPVESPARESDHPAANNANHANQEPQSIAGNAVVPIEETPNQPAAPAPVLPEPAEPLPRAAAVTRIGNNGHNPTTIMGTQPFIELKNQDGQVRRLYLRQQRHQLGRDGDWADLWIPDSGWEVLSRHHAVLEKEGSDYRIYNGNRQIPSTNGIFLNGVLISTHEGYLLKDGDQLVTGHDPRNQVILTYSNPGNSRLAQSLLQSYTQDGQS
jgi:hypothetical protein